MSFFRNLIDDIFNCFCLESSEQELKFKVRINQDGILEQILVKYPHTNRYVLTDDWNTYYVNEILTRWFKKDGMEYCASNHLYETLSYLYGKEPGWYELNTEWIKLVFLDQSIISGYTNFKL